MKLKVFTILLLSCVTVFATVPPSEDDDAKTQVTGIVRLGNTRQAMIEFYGIPAEGNDLPGNASTELFLFRGGSARVLFIDGIAEEITYHKGGSRGDYPIEMDAIRELARFNTCGSQWNQIKEGFWILDSNEAMMIYGRVGTCKHALYVATTRALAYWDIQIKSLMLPNKDEEKKEKKSTAPKDKQLQV